MNFTLWSTLTNFFATPTGQHWDRSNLGARFGHAPVDPVEIDTSTAATGYNVASSVTYTYDITVQDFLGDQQASVLTVATTTMVFPFLTDTGASASSAGVVHYSSLFGSTAEGDSGAVLYWVADGSNYDLDYRPFSDNPLNVATTTPALAFSGAATTLESNVANPISWTFANSFSTLVVAYAVKNGSSENIDIDAFDQSGAPAGTPNRLFALDLVPLAEAVDLTSSGSGLLQLAYADLTHPGQIDLYAFSTTSGTFVSPIAITTPYATIQSIGVEAITTSANLDLLFIQGVTSGSVHSLTVELVGNSGTVINTPVTFALASASPDYFQDDFLDSNNDFVLAYTDNNVVTLAEFNSSGVQIGSSFTVPGITSFDSIRALGDDRVEIDYRSTIAGNNNQVLGLIYDTRTDGIDLSGGIEADMLAGTPSDDIFTASTGNDEINGGPPGASIIDQMSYDLPSITGIVAIMQGHAGIVNKGGANGIDTLKNIGEIHGSSGSDVFYVDASEGVVGGGGFDYLIELTAGVNLSYNNYFVEIAEFVSNVGDNTVDFTGDTSFAYVYGSTGNDTLTLGAGGGYMFGEGGTNVLTGGADATNLFVGGGGGSDTMNGGTGTASNFYYADGSDQIVGAGAFNTMIELATGVTVQIGGSKYSDVQEFVADGGANTVTVGNVSDFTYLYGGAGNDTLTTGSGGGYLFGEGGTNVLNGSGGTHGTSIFVADGGSGADTMNGGRFHNVYFIDANSTVNGAGTFNTVIELQQNVSLALGSAQLGTEVQQVILNGGTNSADFHTATSAVFLYGGAGNDSLFGGTGNDFLFGSTGTNTFEFGVGWGQDTIEDWTAGTNSIIDLTALAGLGVHATTDLAQTVTGGNDVITLSHTGTNSITLLGVGSALTAGSFHFA